MIDWSKRISATHQQIVALEQSKAKAQIDLVSWVDDVTAEITGRVPVDEKLSWASKEQAAHAIVAGTATPMQIRTITSEAEAFGETVDELCTKIILRADQAHIVIATITGLRRRAVKAIGESNNADAVHLELGLAKSRWTAISSQPRIKT